MPPRNPNVGACAIAVKLIKLIANKRIVFFIEIYFLFSINFPEKIVNFSNIKNSDGLRKKIEILFIQKS